MGMSRKELLAILPDDHPTRRVLGEVTASVPRHKAGEMNKTESAFARKLDRMKADGTLDGWIFEPCKLILAPGRKLTYTPDFLLWWGQRIELYEVKGFWRDDARAKIKAAAERYPCFRFVAVTWDRKRQAWHEEKI